MAVRSGAAPRISPEEAKRRLDAGEPIVFVDMRRGSWRRSDVKIAGAVRIPFDDVEEHLADLPREATLVAYCA